MKNWLKLSVFLLMSFSINAQDRVLLEADYTNTTRVKKNIQYPLNVFNRISPINGFRRPENIDQASLCLVRPLGGVATNGSPDLDRDTYKWDGDKFITDFAPLKKQIDNVLNAGLDVYQIVLDNPSWDFQRDANGNLPGGSYLGETYGNAEPPTDFNAWAQYLRQVMNFLVTTYGREKLADIQFGIGREIGTRGHWTGTQQEFFRFYRRSVEAVRSVMPEAKIGSHFLWGSANNSWGTDFVKWCKENDVPYDFVGVSYYPAYNRANRTNFKQVYRDDFSVIKDIPEWNNDAKFEIHEFALTSSFGGNSFTSAPVEYQNSFLVGWMKQFFENDIENLFQWGTGDHSAPANTEILELRGDTYHLNSINGTQNSSSNYVDAIFTSKPNSNELNIMAYNYNSNPNSDTAEDLRFIANVNAPAGSSYRYRSAVFNRSNSAFTYSNWINGTTINGSGNKSQIAFNRSLPVFSFLKYEIEIDQTNTNTTLNQAPTVSFNAPTANATFTVGQEITLSANASDPDGNLDKVNFKINDNFYKSVLTRPFQTTFVPDMAGVYKISALAIDKDNERTEVSINITVVANNQAPEASFTAPTFNTIEAGYNELRFEVAASDADGDRISVLLKIDGNDIRTEGIAPYEWGHEGSDNPMETLGLAPGEHTIEAVVTDARGLATTIVTTLTVTAVATNSAPTVTLTAPVDGSVFTVGDIIDLTATATDPDGNLDKVNFKVNDAFYKSVIQRPFANTFTPDRPGTYKIAAKAIDKDGLSIEEFVTITVDATLSNQDFDTNQTLTKLAVYPSPTHSILNVAGLSSGFTKATVINATGRVVFKSILNTNNNSISVSLLANGLYFLKLQNKLTVKTLMFVKN